MASFSKKVYQVVAAELAVNYRNALTPEERKTKRILTASAAWYVMNIAEGLANTFEQDNRKFNRDLFMAVVENRKAAFTEAHESKSDNQRLAEAIFGKDSSEAKSFGPDARVENHGTIFLVRPLTPLAESWLDSHVDQEDAQHFGNALVVEHRYVQDLVAGMQADGLKVE